MTRFLEPNRQTTSLLFVCSGNICRSPLAEGIFRNIAREAGYAHHFEVDSAGIGAWHAGVPPDPRSVEIARKHTVNIGDQRARQIIPDDFDRFDHLLAMDRDNLAALRSQAGKTHLGKIRLLLQHPDLDVPDPYYGDINGFEVVYQLILNGCHGLLEDLNPL